MLLPREQSPWNCGYYLGAIALESLKTAGSNGLDLTELQREMSATLAKQISLTQAVAAASWLYLLDAVELNESGRLVKCS